MSTATPLVSIILPVYNGERFLAASIESCLKQTHRDLEIIIVNDCSTDKSLQIAQYYASQDDRIRIFSNEVNLMLPASLNKGHELARGAYITWTSDDNRFYENAISTLLTAVKNRGAQFVYSNCDVIDENENTTGFLKAKTPEHLLFENVVGASFLYSREVYDKLGGYNVELPLVEDYDFWLRSLSHFKLVAVNEVLYAYRFHIDSLTADIAKDTVRKKTFDQNKQKALSNFFKSIITEKVENYIPFFTINSREISSFETYFYNDNFWRFIKTCEHQLQGVPSGDLRSIIINIWAKTIVLNPDLQSFKYQMRLWKLGLDAYLSIPLKRRLAIFKKCIL